MADECIECGAKVPATSELQHPDWPFDAICENCHQHKWDEWMEEHLIEYKANTGKDWGEDDEKELRYYRTKYPHPYPHELEEL